MSFRGRRGKPADVERQTRREHEGDRSEQGAVLNPGAVDQIARGERTKQEAGDEHSDCPRHPKPPEKAPSNFGRHEDYPEIEEELLLRHRLWGMARSKIKPVGRVPDRAFRAALIRLRIAANRSDMPCGQVKRVRNKPCATPRDP